MCLVDQRLNNVESKDGGAARDHLIGVACEKVWHLSCRGRQGSGRGTFIPHVQFRRFKGERPYPYSLNLNADIPTFYVRRPTPEQRQNLPGEFAGAHLNPGQEVKIPVPDEATAKRVAAKFLLPIQARK